MKKLIITAAAAMTAMVGFSIESSNVVGYQGTTVAAETYKMVAVQFDSVAGVGEGIPLNDLVKGVPFGTVIQIMDARGLYDTYTYLEEAYDEVTDDFIPAWGDGLENVALVKIVPGTAFWFKAPESTTGTIAGQLLSDASKTIATKASSYTMIGNPYPVATNPNKLSINGINYGDVIQVMDAKGLYDTYTYLEEAYDEVTDNFVPGWGDGLENLITTDVLPAGQGAWMKTSSSAEITFESPIK